MSHRKVHSQGSVAFSWEAKPGVSKATHLDCPTNLGLNAFNLPVMMPNDKKIPPPPCPATFPVRSLSKKVSWGQDDPFLAALKECTKKGKSGKMVGETKFGNVGILSKVRNTKFVFSCKNSCDVEDGNLVRLDKLPPLPTQKFTKKRSLVVVAK